MIRLEIPNSNYHIEYELEKDWDFRIFRHEEDVTKELKYNIVSDMFSMILELQKPKSNGNVDEENTIGGIDKLRDVYDLYYTNSKIGIKIYAYRSDRKKLIYNGKLQDIAFTLGVSDKLERKVLEYCKVDNSVSVVIE